MNKYKTFEAFYRRANFLRALYWICLTVIILFNSAYVIVRSLGIIGYTIEDIFPWGQKKSMILFMVAEVAIYAFHFLMLTFFVNTVFVFANLIKRRSTTYKVLAFILYTSELLGKL